MTPGELHALYTRLWAAAETGLLDTLAHAPYDGPFPDEPPADDHDHNVIEMREHRWRDRT